MKYSQSLQEKIANCSEVVIQQLQQQLSADHLINYLKVNTLETKLRQFIINNKAEYVLLRFYKHQDALTFYQQSNFKDTFWKRPFNIYFNLKLASNEVAKYTLHGLTEAMLREVFVIVDQLGMCKLYTRYEKKGDKAYLNPSAKLNFIRQGQLSGEQQQYLTEKLSKLQVLIEKRRPQDHIQLFSSVLADDTDHQDFKSLCYESAKKIVKKVYPNGIKTIKKIQIAHFLRLKGMVPKLEYKAAIECKSRESILCLFECLRLQLLQYDDASYVRWILNQQKSPNYQILFETNLTNQHNLPTKRYEHSLLEQLRRVCNSVVQVQCQQNKRNNHIFNAKIVFDNEQSGKKFLCSYPNYGSALQLPYSAGKGPNFNIWIDVGLRKQQLEQRNSYRQSQSVANNSQKVKAEQGSDQIQPFQNLSR